MKKRPSFTSGLSVVTLCSLLAASAPSSTALGAEASVSHQSPCLDRKPLTVDDQSKLLMFRAKLSRLDRIRGKVSDDPKRDYAKRLSALIKEASSEMNTPELIEKALEILVEEELRNEIHQTIGLGDEDYSQLHNLSIHPINSSPRLLRKTVTRIKEKLDHYFSAFKPVRRPYALAVEKGAGVRRYHQRLDRLMIETQNWVNRKMMIFALVDQVAAQAADGREEYLEHVRDSFALERKVIQGVGGVAGSIALTVYFGPAIAGASAALGSAGAIGAGCLIGGVGTTAMQFVSDSYTRVAEAYERSRKYGTSLGCELRVINATTNYDLSAAAENVAMGAATGCSVVGAAMLFPRATGVAAIGMVGTAAVSQGVELTHNLAEARKANRLAEELEKKEKKESSQSASIKKQTLYAVFKEAEAMSPGSRALQSYHVYESVKAYHLALQAAEHDNPTQAMRYLEASRHYATEAGQNGLNVLLTGVIMNSFKADLLPAIRSAAHEIPKLLSVAGDDVANTVQILTKTLLIDGLKDS